MDGRNCLRVKLGWDLRAQVSEPAAPPRKYPAYVMWVDLERSGNPVRVDLLRSPFHAAERT